MREPIPDVILLPTLTGPLVPSFPLAALTPVPTTLIAVPRGVLLIAVLAIPWGMPLAHCLSIGPAFPPFEPVPAAEFRADGGACGLERRPA